MCTRGVDVDDKIEQFVHLTGMCIPIPSLSNDWKSYLFQ